MAGVKPERFLGAKVINLSQVGFKTSQLLRLPGIEIGLVRFYIRLIMGFLFHT